MAQNKDLPGGQYGHNYPLLELSDPGAVRKDRIGDKAGTMTKVNPKSKDTNDDDDYRAYTPKEAQKAQSSVDADDMKRQSKGVAGAMPQYKKGGMVKKTGVALVHKGEKVIPKKDVKRTSKAMKKYGGKR
jgi:hypothetical protein